MTLEGEQIERVGFTKFLAIINDENINWKHQINFVVTKLSKICGILYRIRNNLTPEALVTMYYTLCYPHLIYCVSVWACTWPCYLKNVQIAQNKIFRWMFYMNKFESTQDVLPTYEFLSFSNIHIFCYYSYTKALHNSMDINLSI